MTLVHRHIMGSAIRVGLRRQFSGTSQRNTERLASVLQTASPEQLRVEEPAAGRKTGLRARVNKKFRKKRGKARSPASASRASGSNPSAHSSNANVFAYRNTWTTFFDLVLHAENDPEGASNWRPKGVSDHTKAPRWRELPIQERQRLIREREKGNESAPDYAAVKELMNSAPTPAGVLYGDSDDGMGGGFGLSIPNVAPHSEMAPSLTPQLRCQQIVHNHCLSSRDIQAILDLLHDDMLPGMVADSSMYTELVSRLCIEANMQRANEVVNVDLPKQGIAVSPRAQRLLGLPQEALIRMRTSSLRYMASFGMDGIRSADNLFNALLAAGTETIDPVLCAV